jgi:predicted MFS family arabinose efflux permease
VYVFSALLGSASIAICYALAFVRFKAGAPGLAMLDAGIAVGALLGSMAVARSGPDRPGLKFLLGVGAFGATFMLVSLAPNIWLAIPLLVVGGIANMWFFIPATTIYQMRSASDLRGRVMAAYSTVTCVAMVIGIVSAGAIADRMSIPLMITLTGGAAVAVAAVGLTQSALRKA